MQDNFEERAKMRLTERADVETAISLLRQRGYDVEQMLTEMVRLFYVDLDAFHELVNAA